MQFKPVLLQGPLYLTFANTANVLTIKEKQGNCKVMDVVIFAQYTHIESSYSTS